MTANALNDAVDHAAVHASLNTELASMDLSGDSLTKNHELHGIHPYPAKFPPPLPRAIIGALSSPGDLVVDPFCGSGTTLVEALLAGRRAAGSDLNPVATTASLGKTRRLNDTQLALLRDYAKRDWMELRRLMGRRSTPILPAEWEPVSGRRFRGLKFWFEEHVAHELAVIRGICESETDRDLQSVLQLCFSSIIVQVSRQDSDTRYVRREKSIQPGDTLNAFGRRVQKAADALSDFAQKSTNSADVRVADAREFDYVPAGSASLVLTSPPYPNAWSYHLYHQNRILWLGEDPWSFKANEIGSHRDYSRKGPLDQSFLEDMTKFLEMAKACLTVGGHAVVVVGDSTVSGELVRNDLVLEQAGAAAGFRHRATLGRTIDPRRKAFNPRIGRIRKEHVVIFAS